MLVAQFVLVNVVVAVLMKHLEESNKEAREDAELDAELEMEMAQGSPARPRPAAPQSPGASPDSPNVLVVRKVSVSRMLSLPNDSYMFRPVAPAAAAHPHPLQEVEMETYAGAAGTAPGGGSPALRGAGSGAEPKGRWVGAGTGAGPEGRGLSGGARWEWIHVSGVFLPQAGSPLPTRRLWSPAPPSRSRPPCPPRPGAGTPSVLCPRRVQPARLVSAGFSADR